MFQHQFDAGAFCGVGMFRTTSLVRLIWGASALWSHMFLMRPSDQIWCQIETKGLQNRVVRTICFDYLCLTTNINVVMYVA